MVNVRTAYGEVQHGSRDELVLRHATLVKRIALHLRSRLPSHVELDDLIQAGMIGLLEAASHFLADQGASFETFAGLRIRGAMLDQIRREGWVPRSVAKQWRDLSTAIRSVEQRLGREATPAEVAAEMKLSINEYHALLNETSSMHVFSLDQLTESGYEADQPSETITSQPLESLLEQGFESDLATQINTLPERERMVLALYYQESLNMKEIGLVLDVSESRVCQIHTQAVARLRSRLTDWVGAA